MPLAFGTPALVIAVLLAGQLLGDAAGSFFEIGEATLRQAVTDDRWLGRVTAAGRWLAAVLAACGALAAGALAGALGVRVVLFAAAAGQSLAVCWLLRPALRGLLDGPAPAVPPAVPPRGG